MCHIMQGQQFVFVPLILFSILGLTACDDDDDSFSSTTTAGYGYYQFVNLVPQSPDIEFVVDDESQGDIGFAEATATEYVSNGVYDIEFNQILPNTENDSFIDDDSLKVKKDYVHSYILYGDTDAPETYNISIDVSDIFDEDFGDDSGENYAMVQFLNLASTDQNVDCYLLDEDGTLVNQDPDYSLALAESSDDAEVTEGDYKIVFTESGSDTILAMKNGISIEAGEALAYVLVSYEVAGSSDTTRYSIVALNSDGAQQYTNEGADAYIRFANAVSNAGSVSFAQGSSTNTVASNVAFGGISSQLAIDPFISDEAENVEFYVINDDDDSTLTSDTVEIYSGDELLILTAGDVDDSVSLEGDAEDLRVIETHVKLLVAHALDSESEEDFYVKIIGEGSDPASYDADGEIGYLTSELYEVEAGDYDIYIYNEDGDLLVTDEISLFNLQEGDVVNVIVTDSDTGGSPYQINAVFN
jgi:hypothetical protein